MGSISVCLLGSLHCDIVETSLSILFISCLWLCFCYPSMYVLCRNKYICYLFNDWLAGFGVLLYIHAKIRFISLSIDYRNDCVVLLNYVTYLKQASRAFVIYYFHLLCSGNGMLVCSHVHILIYVVWKDYYVPRRWRLQLTWSGTSLPATAWASMRGIPWIHA